MTLKMHSHCWDLSHFLPTAPGLSAAGLPTPLYPGLLCHPSWDVAGTPLALPYAQFGGEGRLTPFRDP